MFSSRNGKSKKGVSCFTPRCDWLLRLFQIVNDYERNVEKESAHHASCPLDLLNFSEPLGFFDMFNSTCDMFTSTLRRPLSSYLSRQELNLVCAGALKNDKKP